ncbi:SAM-dependent DNA methyltransferase, partial [candidate division KSB1 bacterium]|nr:SAM-dependent DNA methyltransferase [candidate division KSB1 bacterium]
MAQTPERLRALETLNTHLREAVELVALSMAPLHFRNQLFAILLLKRLNDLWEERSKALEREALEAGRSQPEARAIADDPDEHRFFVPVAARWSTLLNTAENLGAQIELACSELERHNPNLLSGVSATIGFTVSGTRAEQEPHETMLRKLLLHFDKFALGDSALRARTLVSRGGAYLIEYLATWGAKKGAASTSPAALMQLLAELLQPEAGMRVCDPACGVGGALVACAEYLHQRGGNPQALSYFGQEYDANTWALCKMNLLLHDLMDARLVLGSTISHPMLEEDGRLLTFDLVISEPPFSLLAWEHEAAARTSFGRFAAGIPPARHGELAFVQHIAATLNARGRAAIIVPHGVLFRGGSEKQIRAALLQPETDLVEAVIALPEGVLHGLKAPAAVLLLNRNKNAARQRRVLFVDANLVAAPNAFVLNDATRLKLVALYSAFGAREKLSAAVERKLQDLQRAVANGASAHAPGQTSQTQNDLEY